METLRACPVCNTAIRLDADEVLYPDPLFPGGQLHVTRCDACGVSFLNPRLTLDENEHFEDENDFYRITPEEREQQTLALEEMLRTLTTYPARSETLLDVGCNRGVLLGAARNLGWTPTGVELSPVAATEARASVGAPVYRSLADVPRDGRGFDLIVAWHVLEHTLDPVGFLREARALLSDGGVVALQVPSYDFVDRYLEDGRLASIACSVHNFYLGRDGLLAIVTRAGLRPLHLSNSKSDLMLTAILAPVETGRPTHSLGNALFGLAARARRRVPAPSRHRR